MISSADIRRAVDALKANPSRPLGPIPVLPALAKRLRPSAYFEELIERGVVVVTEPIPLGEANGESTWK